MTMVFCSSPTNWSVRGHPLLAEQRPGADPDLRRERNHRRHSDGRAQDPIHSLGWADRQPSLDWRRRLLGAHRLLCRSKSVFFLQKKFVLLAPQGESVVVKSSSLRDCLPLPFLPHENGREQTRNRSIVTNRLVKYFDDRQAKLWWSWR